MPSGTTPAAIVPAGAGLGVCGKAPAVHVMAAAAINRDHVGIVLPSIVDLLVHEVKWDLRMVTEISQTVWKRVKLRRGASKRAANVAAKGHGPPRHQWPGRSVMSSERRHS